MAAQLALGLADLNQRDEWYWYVCEQLILSAIVWLYVSLSFVLYCVLWALLFNFVFCEKINFSARLLFFYFFLSVHLFINACIIFIIYISPAYLVLKYSFSVCQLELARLYAESANFSSAIECINTLLKISPNLRTEFKVRRKLKQLLIIYICIYLYIYTLKCFILYFLARELYCFHVKDTY